MIDIFIVIVFLLGYLAITFEHRIGVNKAAIALLMAVSCWALLTVKKCYQCGVSSYLETVLESFNTHLHEISQVILFLLGAMTIVALIETHGGFKIVTDFIRTRDKRKLLWLTSFLAFFLSAVLDNMTTAIVMTSLVRRLIEDREDRLIFAGMIIVAANAGGAWTPIGDVTTTMLWIGGRVTSGKIMELLLIPSLISLAVPLVYFSSRLTRGTVPVSAGEDAPMAHDARGVFFLGIGTLIFVPVFKALTGLPPFMGMMLGLAAMWVMTDLAHRQRDHLKVPHVLSRIDISSILFFLGILLAVAALQTAGILDGWASRMDASFRNKDVIVALIGLGASLIGSVPLTAAAMGMYGLGTYPVDSKFWEMVAYSVGTGGSLLIIGSAAGVVVMGMEKISFTWYLRKVSSPVLIGYLAGILSFLAIYPVVAG